MFLRLAVFVTLVLWLPVLGILYRGQPPRVIAVLMLTHLAIALVTCNLLVHVASARPDRQDRAPQEYFSGASGQQRGKRDAEAEGRLVSSRPPPSP